MNEAITYAGAIWMIIGWTIGKVIGIILIDRLDKKNVK
jgi:energy-converting hydrogenase Eha subunit E